MHAEADNRTRPPAAGVIVRILLVAAVVGIVEAAEVEAALDGGGCLGICGREDVKGGRHGILDLRW